MNHKNKIHVFWDLDGVIFQYERFAYIGKNPPYAQAGYFKNRKIDPTAYRIFEKMRYNHYVTGLHILSRGATRLNQQQRRNIISDKKSNVKKDIDWFPDEDVIITEQPKTEAAISFLGRSLQKTDILIDDFNANLNAWRNAGGCAIKYINGINSMQSYHGPKLKNNELFDVRKEELDVYKAILKDVIFHT